ncbi:hypothetical protein [Microbacterium stercoris]|uniref:DUF4145 domain-containing protein n=1 Tax=Microbacterium stercoris TaxID=2820289 RepID=A0A939TU71_9MICO|nr:hypothetical protein [Microbacterium stercoris]MBO3663719.1 hypothetical protein [Microbacterium stercoris]
MDWVVFADGAREISAVLLEYVKVLAWPLLVLTGLIMFRSSLRDVLGRIRSASGWGGKVELDAAARKAAEDSEEIPELADAEPSPSDGGGRDHPEAVLGRFIIAFAKLEVVVRDTAVALHVPEAGHSLRTLARKLRRLGFISAETEGLAYEVQSMRNEIIHHADRITFESGWVDNFIEATTNLERVLRSVGRKGDPAEEVGAPGA